MKTTRLFLSLFIIVLCGLKGNAQANSYFAGINAGYTGTNNTYVGYGAAEGASGASNAVFGDNSFTNSTGSSNCVLGSFAMSHGDVSGNNSGDGNSAFGYRALNNNDTGSENVAVGYDAMRSNTIGDRNVAIGRDALYNNSGDDNIAIGYRAGTNNIAGVANIYMGKGAGTNATGSNNAFIGLSSGELTTGGSNNFFGYQSGPTNTSGSGNLFLGNRSGLGVSTGSNNTFLGQVAVTANVSNTTILADGSGNQRLYVSPTGRTGIGLANNTIPLNQLELGTAGIAGTTGLRFNSFATTGANTTGKVLTVNSTGDVIVADAASGTGATSIINGTNTTVTGNGSVATPYQINSTAATYLADGTNTTISGTGTSADPYKVSAGDKSIYTNDGFLSRDRKVTMNGHYLWFATGSHSTNEKIYIGRELSFDYPENELHPFEPYKLYVEGGILTEKVKVALRDSNDWADYVFAGDYKLMPIKEVHSFIKENKHLPGVASADDLACEGLDLAAMQSKQMEKIEELTLYIIEQDKALDKQQKQIEELTALVGQLLKK